MQERKPRLEPRLVFAVALLVLPLLYLAAHVILVRPAPDCGATERAQVGGVGQMFVPGDGCSQPPRRP